MINKKISMMDVSLNSFKSNKMVSMSMLMPTKMSFIFNVNKWAQKSLVLPEYRKI